MHSVTVRNIFHRAAVPLRKFLSTSQQCLGAYDAEFNKAKETLNTLKDDPGNQVKLQIYGLFKQATTGPCRTKRPGMVDFVGRAKWDAWNALGDMSQDDAQKTYIDLVNSLAGSQSTTEPASTDSQSGEYQTIKVTSEDKVTTITLNRPDKYNAINLQMYDEWTRALNEAGKNGDTVTVLTGAGKYYCSGNDLSNFTNLPEDGIEGMARRGKDILREFVAAFIDHPKPLVGVVNGPAVGVSVTTLGLCDAIFASDNATFNTPFTQLGQSPEGCSSYILPKVLGHAKANEMLLFNRKLTAAEAAEFGFVTDVFPQDYFQTEVWARIKTIAQLPPQSLMESKKLIRDQERETLHAINKKESEVLMERWLSEECMNAIMGFFQRK